MLKQCPSMGNKYVKMDSEIGKGVQALKHPLSGSTPAAKKVNIQVSNKEYYTDFQLFRIFLMIMIIIR